MRRRHALDPQSLNSRVPFSSDGTDSFSGRRVYIVTQLEQALRVALSLAEAPDLALRGVHDVLKLLDLCGKQSTVPLRNGR